MNKALSITSLMLLFLSLFSQNPTKKCGFEDALEQVKNTPEYLQVQKEIKSNQAFSGIYKADTVIRIPVVFHIIWKHPNQNIDESQIYSQLEVLNKDYRLLNSDIGIVPAQFSKADVKLEFCLAKIDPNGNYTHGITRTQTTLEDLGVNNQYFVVRPIWDRDKYLNVWVCDFGNNIAGQAFPPGSPSDRDGVVIDYTNFGTTGTVVYPYDLGRTLTHEIGHWLNLFHIWGQNDRNPSCASDDDVADTPNQSAIYFNCPGLRNSCSSPDNTNNFMGYVDDRCMANFTAGQKTRMRNAILNSRPGIISSDRGCNYIGLDKSFSSNLQIFPNPAKGQVKIKFSNSKPNDLIFSLYDLNGKQISPAELQTNTNEIELDIHQLKSGIYFLEISSNNKKAIKKLIINN